jgi:hypothetical protein
MKRRLNQEKVEKVSSRRGKKKGRTKRERDKKKLN